MPLRPQKLQLLLDLMQSAGLQERDLHEQFVRASGRGGQKVNKTSSAVYLKHIPSGLEVKVQAHRSQALNRFVARRLLAERLLRQQGQAQREQDARVEKLRRQKRRRSRRARAKTVADKRQQGAKKSARSARFSEDP